MGPRSPKGISLQVRLSILKLLLYAFYIISRFLLLFPIPFYLFLLHFFLFCKVLQRNNERIKREIEVIFPIMPAYNLSWFKVVQNSNCNISTNWKTQNWCAHNFKSRHKQRRSLLHIQIQQCALISISGQSERGKNSECWLLANRLVGRSWLSCIAQIIKKILSSR